MKLLFVSIVLVVSFLNLSAQNSRKIALLPIVSNGIDEASSITAESILRLELSKQPGVILTAENRTLRPFNAGLCIDEECAKLIGENLNVDQVVLSKLNRLGDKIIVQYLLVDILSGKNKLVEQTVALNLADLEPVMKRVAISIAKETPFSENVEVGNVVGKESIESSRRKSRYNFGMDFGYLFPQNGYEDDNKSLTINAYFDHEIQQYAVGLMAGARNGFAINIYGNYLFSNADICPYLGGSLGVHWVQHNDSRVISPGDNGLYNSAELSGNGIELGFKGGIRLLHTYNVQLFIGLEFIITFNDYEDRAVVFTIGIL